MGGCSHCRVAAPEGPSPGVGAGCLRSIFGSHWWELHQHPQDKMQGERWGGDTVFCQWSQKSNARLCEEGGGRSLFRGFFPLFLYRVITPSKLHTL